MHTCKYVAHHIGENITLPQHKSNQGSHTFWKVLENKNLG